MKLNKVIIEERKKKWQDVRFRLEFVERYKKHELKKFESYFVKGQEPKLHPIDEDPIPLVYCLWLAPDQSVEGWAAITEKFLAGPVAWETDIDIEPTDSSGGVSWRELSGGSTLGSAQISRSLRDSYDILMQFAAASYFDGVTPFYGTTTVPPLGFMGGIEKKIYDFMVGKTPGSEHFFYQGKRLFEPSGRLAGCYKELCIWLDGKLPHNPYSVIYYMNDVWFVSLTDKYMDLISSDAGVRFYLDCYLKLIARYPCGDLKSQRQKYCDELRGLLNSGMLLEPMKTMWLEAKIYSGPIDLNAYMKDDPYFLGVAD